MDKKERNENHFFPIPITKLLAAREVGGKSRSFAMKHLRDLRVKKSLSTLKQLEFSQDSQGRILKQYKKIDKYKSIYLGISHDSTLLVRLSLDMLEEDEFQANPFESSPLARISFSTWFISPTVLYPHSTLLYGISRSKSEFFVGFSKNMSFMVVQKVDDYPSTSLRPISMCVYGERIFPIYLDLAFFELKLRLTFNVLMAIRDSKMIHRQISGNRIALPYFRIINTGILLDTGSEVTALTLWRECPPNPNERNKETFIIYSSNGNHSRSGPNFRDITACKLSNSGNYYYNIQPYSENKENSTTQNTLDEGRRPLFFLTETVLSTEEVLKRVAMHHISNTKNNDDEEDCKFMGVTASEIFLLDVVEDQLNQNNTVVIIRICGVVEIQQTRKYSFVKMDIKLRWNVNSPSKISLLGRDLQEMHWLEAIDKKMAWLRGIAIFYNFRPEDRQCTNKVCRSQNELSSGRTIGGEIALTN